MAPMDSERTIGDPHGPDISSLLAMTLPCTSQWISFMVSYSILPGYSGTLKLQLLLGGQLVAPMDSWRTIGGPHGS